MFIVQPMYPSEWQDAMFLLSHYNVNIALYSDAENLNSVYGVVAANLVDDTEERYDEDDLRLAEIAFQMNWRQGNALCPYCNDDDGHKGHCCGHLTFTSIINSTEFDKIFGGGM